MSTTFDTLPLRPELLVGVERLGYTEMTDIQAKSLPPALDGADIVGHARTGSGKTAAFGLVLLQKLDVARRVPQAMIISPTRELADQLVASIRALAVGLDGVRVLLVSGGNSSRDQRDALQAGAHVIVGTPGRLLHQLDLQRIDARSLTTLVLDEADRMLDMGFEDEVLGILAHLPSRRQTLLFSATWPDATRELSEQIQRDPQMVGTETLVDAAVLKQSAVLCVREDRRVALQSVLAEREPVPTLIFCETREQCKATVGFLSELGVAALALHGELEQRDRDEVMVCFRNGTARVLVATNVAARGLDVEGIRLVINYELPRAPEIHVHRIGRTARAEASGEAVSLVVSGGQEVRRLKEIEKHMGAPIKRVPYDPSGTGKLDGWASDWRTLVVLGGRRDKLRPGDLLGALTRGVGLKGAEVGMMVLTDKRAWIAVKASEAQKATEGLNRERIKKKRYRVHLVGRGD
ncbi:MAG: ATP-independent RNA helicase DbpA [Bradymonadia bacterium]|jgi:ATP-independent RNA helicase DbpA